jgi:hypothetical protein
MSENTENTIVEPIPTFHDMNRKPVFRSSERKILEDSIKMWKKNNEVSIDLIEILKKEIADLQERCEGLVARNDRLESRDYLNRGAVE